MQLQEISVRNVGTAVEEGQPVELIEATESDRSTGFSDQRASAQEPRTCPTAFLRRVQEIVMQNVD